MTIDALSQSFFTAPLRRDAGATVEGGIQLDKVVRLDTLTATRLPPNLRPLTPLDPDVIMSALREAGLVPDGGQSDLFAEVYKNGKVVGRLYNGGSAETLGVAAGTITGDDEPYGGGPQLAQWRADKIAKAVGGTVKLAPSAQTQAQWQATSAAAQLKHDQVLAQLRAAMDASYGPDATSAPVSVTA